MLSANKRGFSLIELIASAALLTGAIYFSIRSYHARSLAKASAQASAETTRLADEVGTAVLGVIQTTLKVSCTLSQGVLGGASTVLDSGLKVSILSPTQIKGTASPLATALLGPVSLAAQNRCKSQNWQSQADQSAATSFYACVLIQGTPTMGTNLTMINSMQPFFAEVVYTRWHLGQARNLSCTELQNPVLIAGSVGYLNSAFYWNSIGQTPANQFNHYSVISVLNAF